jgi:hypothetical protein
MARVRQDCDRAVGCPPAERATACGAHAEQHFEYFRPIFAGEMLTANVKQGAVWEKQSRRAGKLLFSEQLTEFRDQAGELVCRIRNIVMTPERPVSAD